MIDQTRWAQEFEWSQLEVLVKYMELRMLEPGTLIFSENATATYMGLVLNGKISIFKEDLECKNKVISSLSPGMTFGEMALIDGEPRSASATADNDTTVALLSYENFYHLVNDHPRLGLKLVMKLAKLMSQRLRNASGKLIDHLSE